MRCPAVVCSASPEGGRPAGRGKLSWRAVNAQRHQLPAYPPGANHSVKAGVRGRSLAVTDDGAVPRGRSWADGGDLPSAERGLSGLPASTGLSAIRTSGDRQARGSGPADGGGDSDPGAAGAVAIGRRVDRDRGHRGVSGAVGEPLPTGEREAGLARGLERTAAADRDHAATSAATTSPAAGPRRRRSTTTTSHLDPAPATIRSTRRHRHSQRGRRHGHHHQHLPERPRSGKHRQTLGMTKPHRVGEPMRGSVRNRPEEASFQGGRVSRAMKPDPEGSTSRWLHQQKPALKPQSARRP
jgi:hypothetical protein